MYKKLSVISLSIVMAAGLVACSGKKNASETTAPKDSSSSNSTVADGAFKEHAKLKIIYYPEQSNRMKEFVANEIKALVKKELNADLELEYLPWSEVGSGKTDLMLASGEDFASYTDIAAMANKVSKGYYTDLTPYVDYASDLKKNVEESSFKAFQLNGKQYAIPVGKKPNASEWSPFLIRQDLVQEVGMTKIASLEDLEKLYDLVHAKYPDMIGFAGDNAQAALSYSITDKNLLWPTSYVVTDASANNDKIWSWFESPEFKAYSEIMRKWYTKGIIPKYTASNPNQLSADWQAGKALFKTGNATGPMEEEPKIKKAVPNVKLVNYFPGKGDRPLIDRGTYSTAYFVSASAKDPARYVAFFNLLQKNQELYDLFYYGVKDKDYKIDSNNQLELINKDALFDGWMLANTNFIRYDSSISEDTINTYKHWNDGSILRKDIGFVFNAESVKAEQAKISAVETELLKPISSGFVSYEEYFPKALQKLKAAGIDRYVAEYQKQFSAWFAQQKK
jgi:putative aldouronate transport system substrate-binding protein